MRTPSSPEWDRVSLILDSLLDRPEHEWAAALDERCGDDAALRRQVLRLLAAHRRANGFLSRPFSLAAPTLTGELEEAFAKEEVAAPERVGSWRLLRELGRGGMAVVYLAERTGEQFSQRGALKLVHAGLGSGEILARFRRERQILAGLNHPYIARLLDGGRAEDGRPYLIMEYVEGRPLTRYCRERALDVEARLRLFVNICHAVQHAHVRLVVHRDLKPSNILITDAGEPRLLDFGIAKLLAQDETAATLTRTGLPLMTPEYAAPEQLRGEAVSTATDVYALGLILYELLAGRHPWRDPIGAANGDSAGRREPPRPSLAMADRVLRRRLAGDLDTIVLMALREEPARRYASAEALARDIERHLAGLPVSARPDTVGYRARKFASRHRWGVRSAPPRSCSWSCSRSAWPSRRGGPLASGTAPSVSRSTSSSSSRSPIRWAREETSQPGRFSTGGPCGSTRSWPRSRRFRPTSSTRWVACTSPWACSTGRRSSSSARWTCEDASWDSTIRGHSPPSPCSATSRFGPADSRRASDYSARRSHSNDNPSAKTTS